MARLKINHIKVDVFSKKGRLSIARMFAQERVKGGAWVVGGRDNQGQACWTGVWANAAGAVDQLATEADKKQDQAET